MAKKSALGKGLGALIKQSETEIPERQVYSTDKINIGDIDLNPYQPRTNFDQESLEELASSIRLLGIIQPITVREIDNGKFQIISGERRYRASLMAGLTEIPAYIRHADDNNMLEMALVENIQREDLDAIEIAISYQRLIDECQLTQENVSERVGKKRSTIANYLRLLKLPAEIQLAIRYGQISMGHARALVNVEQTDQQLQLFHDIIENGLSVRQVETTVRKINHPEEIVEIVETEEAGETEEVVEIGKTEEIGEAETAISPSSPLSPAFPISSDFPDLESQDDEVIIYEDPQPNMLLAGNDDERQLKEQLSMCFGTKVDLRRSTSGVGRVVIPFRTDAELNHILQMAKKINELSEAFS